MNIHFNDFNLFLQLKNNTIFNTKVGSHMYNLNNENSDVDYLNIYLEERSSVLWEHHQLQYKENNENHNLSIDHNFSSLQSFIRNILTGDATINFEVLYSEDLKNSSLNWLYDIRDKFQNYQIIRSYIGLTKRDFKMFLRESKEFKIINNENSKKLSHFLRGYVFSIMLIEKNFDILMNTNYLSEVSNGLTDNRFLYNLKNSNFEIDDKFIKFILNIGNEKLDELRNVLNKKFEKKEISRYLDIETLEFVDNKVIELNKNFNLKNYVIDYGDILYDALENGIEYNN